VPVARCGLHRRIDHPVVELLGGGVGAGEEARRVEGGDVARPLERAVDDPEAAEVDRERGADKHGVDQDDDEDDGDAPLEIGAAPAHPPTSTTTTTSATDRSGRTAAISGTRDTTGSTT